LLHNKFGFTVPDVLRLIDYGFRAAFVDEGMRKRLRIEAFLKATRILSDEGIDLSGISGTYYAGLGVTFPPRFLPPVANPRMTIALVAQLPKCDLDCRLIGSVPLSLLYRFYTDLPEENRNELPSCSSLEEFTAYCLRECDRCMRTEAKNLATALLQTEPNLRAATHAILYEAFVDKVLYLELTVCPTGHTRRGLTPEMVLDVVLDEIGKFKKKHDIRVSLVINANIAKSSPLDVHRLAELAVAYHGRGVVGFATTTAEISVAEMRFFEQTFAYLSDNFVPVTIFAGETAPESVSSALVRGHARRISGGFQITQNESLLNDVISHNIAVLISRSKRMEAAMPGWKGSPVRFFTDFGVNLAFCSIHHGFANMSRSEQLFQLAEQAGFGAGALLKLIAQTFSAAFIPHKEVTAYQERFWKEASAVLSDCGFSAAVEYVYFPE
jgi:adenosine deaminase